MRRGIKRIGEQVLNIVAAELRWWQADGMYDHQ